MNERDPLQEGHLRALGLCVQFLGLFLALILAIRPHHDRLGVGRLLIELAVASELFFVPLGWRLSKYSRSAYWLVLLISFPPVYWSLFHPFRLGYLVCALGWCCTLYVALLRARARRLFSLEYRQLLQAEPQGPTPVRSLLLLLPALLAVAAVLEARPEAPKDDRPTRAEIVTRNRVHEADQEPGARLPFHPFLHAREGDWLEMLDSKDPRGVFAYEIVSAQGGVVVRNTTTRAFEAQHVFSGSNTTFSLQKPPTLTRYFYDPIRPTLDPGKIDAASLTQENFPLQGHNFACTKISFRTGAGKPACAWFSTEVLGGGLVVYMVDDQRLMELRGYGTATGPVWGQQVKRWE